MVKLYLLAFAVVSISTAIPARAETPKFKVGIELPSQTPVPAAVKASLKDMGIGYLNYYLVASPANDLPPQETNAAMLDLCDSLGVDFSIACHHIDVPDFCVKDAAARGKSRFRGVVIDELEHARLMNNYSPTPLANFGSFSSLDQAYKETLEGYTKIKDRYKESGAKVTATHIWPVMEHIAAKTEYTVCPKICKELYSTVSLAIGMGAALQYDRELWADCDLWFWDLVPGHSPEEMKSNLLLAYWLGTDLVYVEGSGFNLKPTGKQGIPFSLMKQIDPDTYQLTEHGETLRWFCRDYLPQHPRKWTFRDVLPNMAIIRFEDTCHGQRYCAGFPDNLYGSDKLHSDRDTEAWLGLWNMLTFGTTGRDGLSFFKAWVAPSGYQRGVEPNVALSYKSRPVQADQHHFFVPLNGCVVFDHTVGYEHLKDIPLLFITGKEVSSETLAAVRRCVEDGAVCVAWGPLMKKNGFSDWESGVRTVPQGKGRFVLTDDFGFREVYEQINTLIGRPDEIHYRFKQGDVVLRKVTEDEVRVEVTER